MFLSEIFEQLTIGELSSLNMGGDSNIGLQECEYANIVPHINLGLTELYSRFSLDMSEVMIQQDASIIEYFLDYKYAVSNTASTEPIKYILDTVENPFNDEIIKIETVFNSDGDNTLLPEDYPDTDLEDFWARIAPSYKSIIIPKPITGTKITVTYRAAHKKILSTNLNPFTTEINIPIVLLQPLLYFIAGRVFSIINTDELQEGTAYMAKFEQACNNILKYDLIKEEYYSNVKLDKNEWV